jgi:hypothetical protein
MKGESNMNKNQETAKRIDNLKGLSERAKDVIAATDINIFDDVFGIFETAEEINEYVEEYYPED